MAEQVRIDNNLNTILWYVLRRLIDQGVCTATSGFIGQNPDRNAVPPSSNYVVVSARKQALLNAETQTWAGDLTVRVWAASMLDIAMRDYTSLTQTSVGNGLQLWVNNVISALNMYDLNNGAYYFLAYPMRYTQQSDEFREVDKDSQSFNWSYVDIVFEFVYGENPNFVGPQVNGIDEYSYEYDASFM